MLEQSPKTEQVRNTLQEPCCPVYTPTSYMLLLAALDNGWKIIKMELAPSWDQYGLIYLISLKHQYQKHTQLSILPKNPTIEKLLRERNLLCALG